MTRKSPWALIAGESALLLGLTPATLQAQSNGDYEVATNKIAIATPADDKAVSPSPEALELRIRDQQSEIARLEQRLQKLEAALEARGNLRPEPSLASLSGALPVANPAPPPPPPPTTASFARTSRELLPDIGQIGAEVGVLVGSAQNPFHANNGFLGAGFIDLPLKRFKGGKLSYEILAGLQRSTTHVTTTSGVIALVNAVANVELGTPPSIANLLGPLPITNTGTERQTVLSVVPFSLKYTLTGLDHLNIRPYMVAGLGTYVALSTQNNKTTFDATTIAALPAGVGALLNSLLQGPQVAGLAPESPELRARGVAAGQGDFRFGLNLGGGVEIRLSPKLSMGFDYRFNKPEGRNSAFSTFAFSPAVHF